METVLIFHNIINEYVRKPVGDTYGGRQKSYLAAARREELSGGRQKTYLAAAR